MFRLVIGLKTDSKDIEGGRCMRGGDGKLYFSEKERGKVWKHYVEWIMNEENDWDHNLEGGAVEGPIVCVCREEVLQALNEMKTGKAHGPSEVSLQLTAEWALSMFVPIFKGMGDIRNCSCYRAVNLLEHGMKVVEKVLEKRLRRIVSVDEMQFGFMLERGTIYAAFILRRLQEEYHAKGKKLYMCFVDQEKAFDRVPRKMLELAMRKKGIPEVLDRSVMCLYEGAKTRVRVDSELSEEFEVKVAMQQGSVLSSFPFAVVVVGCHRVNGVAVC